MDRQQLIEQLNALHAASYGWSLSCCAGDSHLAKDALQTAYCRVLQGTARFGEKSSFRTWLFGVIRLTALEQQRIQRKNAAQALNDAAEMEAESQPEPIQQMVAAETQSGIWKVLNTLSERQREVLHLVFYEDMTVQEAAETMGVSVGSARQHFHRGKQAIRDTHSNLFKEWLYG